MAMPKSDTRIFILVLSGALVLSFTGLIIRQIDAANAWQVLFFRSLGFIATLSLFLIFKYKSEAVSLHRKIDLWGFGTAIFIGLSFGMNIYALTIVSVAQAYFILSTLPLMTALLSWIFLNEKVDRTTWVTIVIVFVGVAIMIADDFGSLNNIFGLFIALLSPTFFAIALVLVRARKQIDTIPATWLAGFVSLVLAASLMGSLDQIIIEDALWGGMMGVTLGVGVACYVIGAKYISATHVAVLMLLETALAPIWAWLGVGEKPTTMILLGGLIMFAAVAVRAGLGFLSERGKYRPTV